MIIKDIKCWDTYVGLKTIIDGVTFLNSKEISLIYKACDGSISKLCTLFNSIGIEYDKIDIMQKSYISYSIGENNLSLSQLSSGERFLLYLLACRETNTEIVAVGLFERLGDRLTEVVYDELRDFNGLTILLANVCLDLKFDYYRG